MKKLEIDNITYEWNDKDCFEKSGRTFQYASLKKIVSYKGNKKYQTVTVRPQDLPKFLEFLKEIYEDTPEGDEPF